MMGPFKTKKDPEELERERRQEWDRIISQIPCIPESGEEDLSGSGGDGDSGGVSEGEET